MIVCQHEQSENLNDVQFTVIFEAKLNEPEILNKAVDASEGQDNFETCLYNMIMKAAETPYN